MLQFVALVHPFVKIEEFQGTDKTIRLRMYLKQKNKRGLKLDTYIRIIGKAFPKLKIKKISEMILEVLL